MDSSEVQAAVKEIASKQRMDALELEAIVQEFDAMRRTKERDVATFVVRAATPERIDRLYRIPEIVRLPRSLRENGLIFAGQPGSRLLSYDKPSDIIGKVSSWFPDEIARARTNSRLWRGDIHLYGPFKDWEAEPAAFMAMWNCVPQIAWLQPDRSPFRKVSGTGHPLAPLGAKSSQYTEFDFGQCVRERNGEQLGRTLEESQEINRWVRTMGERVVPKLQDTFARFLKTERCRGTGPDDCVLILYLWASLTPDDTELAGMIQTLEADVALDSPLPPMAKPFDRSRPEVEAGAARFDEIWRRAAFLRTKLVSILDAESVWPSGALHQAIRQIIALQQALQDPYAAHYDYVDIDYRTPASSPWRVLYSRLKPRDQDANGIPAALLSWQEQLRDAATLKRVRAAVIEELSGRDGKVDCSIAEPWLFPKLKAEFVLGLLQRPDAQIPACLEPDWRWLVAGESQDAVDFRAGYLDLVQTAQDRIREMILTKLTDGGDHCFRDNKDQLPNWLEKLCKRWIHEPATVRLTLEHTRLTLDKPRQFDKSVNPAPTRSETGDQGAWLVSLAKGVPAGTKAALLAYAKELHRKNLWVESATLWQHPGHSRSLIELDLKDGSCTRLLLLLSPDDLRQIDVPERIWRRESCRSGIVRISDLDGDGNLELWWALDEWGGASFDKCKGDSSDLDRHVDCSAKRPRAKMAEISGDTLTYFVDSSGAIPLAPVGESWTSSGNTFALRAGSKVDAMNIDSCNRMLIGSVLSAKLGIGEWSKAGTKVIALACARHPGNPDHTLVALFHEPLETGAAERGDVGFAVAVIDLKQGKVFRLYRDTVEENGSIRVRGSSDGALRLDTARYKLAPNVRAFGVRMNIGYSPSAAEGGSNNFLTLFVEEGRKLRPVLKNFTMSSWGMVDSSGCFDQAEDRPCVIESDERVLSLSSSSTNGWRDFDVISTTTREGESKPVRRVLERKLRYQNNQYQ